MSGYVAASKITFRNTLDAVAHDLAVLTLSRPFDLSGRGVRAADVPDAHTKAPSRVTQLVIAGFGNEHQTTWNGTLNEVTKASLRKRVSNPSVLAMFATTAPCLGDSGMGAVEPGRHPTVFGIFSEGLGYVCRPGIDYYVSLAAPSALQFIKSNR
jgi:hypothetical protein